MDAGVRKPGIILPARSVRKRGAAPRRQRRTLPAWPRRGAALHWINSANPNCTPLPPTPLALSPPRRGTDATAGPRRRQPTAAEAARAGPSGAPAREGTREGRRGRTCRPRCFARRSDGATGAILTRNQNWRQRERKKRGLPPTSGLTD